MGTGFLDLRVEGVSSQFEAILEGFHLTLDYWRPGRDGYSWRLKKQKGDLAIPRIARRKKCLVMVLTDKAKLDKG